MALGTARQDRGLWAWVLEAAAGEVLLRQLWLWAPGRAASPPVACTGLPGPWRPSGQKNEITHVPGLRSRAGTQRFRSLFPFMCVSKEHKEDRMKL